MAQADTSQYTEFVHRHRFSAWAAARAAQRGWANGSTAALSEAVDRCGVRQVLLSGQWPDTASAVDSLHRSWCRGMLTSWAQRELVATYGRAAKLLNVYLKSMLIIGPHASTRFAQLAHPPIDDILLTRLSGERDFSADSRRLWRSTRWTKLDEAAYFKIITSLRAEGLDRPAFWHVERYWEAGQ